MYYNVIKTRKWYDPEGLNIPQDGEICFTDTLDECRGFINYILDNAKNSDRQCIEKCTDTQVVIYYPYAISKAVYTIVKAETVNVWVFKKWSVNVPTSVIADVSKEVSDVDDFAHNLCEFVSDDWCPDIENPIINPDWLDDDVINMLDDIVLTDDAEGFTRITVNSVELDKVDGDGDFIDLIKGFDSTMKRNKAISDYWNKYKCVDTCKQFDYN